MKKILLLILLILCLCVFGCSNNTNENPSKPNDSENTEQSGGNTDQGGENLEDGNITIDYGKMSIENLILYVGFPNKPIITFSKLEYAVQINNIYFEYSDTDSSFITFDGEYFNALSGGKTITVYAETEYHQTQFTITTKNYVEACKDESNANFYTNRANQKENYWKSNGKQTGGTVFIGDSFFDTEFWSDFYTLYEGNNTYTNGISSSTTTDWEIWVGKLLYPLNPKNIVMHCGTNNLYDDRESADMTIANTKRLLDTIHYHLPETKVYYFAIEPRTYGIGTSTFDSTTYYKIYNVNNAMKQYCEENSYMVYVDVTPNCYNGGITVNKDFFRDGVHPKLENYIVYANALKDAGLDLVINEKVLSDTTTSLSFTTSHAINKGDSVVVKENGTVLGNEFSIKGNILVTKVVSNAHIEFNFADANNRFLLWDNDNNTSLSIGYACNGSYSSNLSTAGAYLNYLVSFELVVTSRNAYLYLDGKLAMVFLNIYASTTTIGTEGCAVEFTDLVITSKKYNLSGYNAILSRSEIAQYENSTNNIKQVIVC